MAAAVWQVRSHPSRRHQSCSRSDILPDSEMEKLCAPQSFLLLLCFPASFAASDDLIEFVPSLLKELRGFSFRSLFFSYSFFFLNWLSQMWFVCWTGSVRGNGNLWGEKKKDTADEGEKRLKGSGDAEGRENWKRCLAKWREMLDERSSSALLPPSASGLLYPCSTLLTSRDLKMLNKWRSKHPGRKISFCADEFSSKVGVNSFGDIKNLS